MGQIYDGFINKKQQQHESRQECDYTWGKTSDILFDLENMQTVNNRMRYHGIAIVE